MPISTTSDDGASLNLNAVASTNTDVQRAGRVLSGSHACSARRLGRARTALPATWDWPPAAKFYLNNRAPQDGLAACGRAANARGFTLLELLMVIVMIAAITGMTVGLLGVGRSGSQLRSAVHTVATELRYTRVQALTTGVSQVFDMDLDKRTWTAAGTHHGTLPSSLQTDFVAVRVEQTSAHNAAIRFFPDGSSTGGRISLRTKGAGWRVDVRWLTGEVTQTPLSADEAR